MVFLHSQYRLRRRRRSLSAVGGADDEEGGGLPWWWWRGGGGGRHRRILNDVGIPRRGNCHCCRPSCPSSGMIMPWRLLLDSSMGDGRWAMGKLLLAQSPRPADFLLHNSCDFESPGQKTCPSLFFLEIP